MTRTYKQNHTIPYHTVPLNTEQPTNQQLFLLLLFRQRYFCDSFPFLSHHHYLPPPHHTYHWYCWYTHVEINISMCIFLRIRSSTSHEGRRVRKNTAAAGRLLTTSCVYLLPYLFILLHVSTSRYVRYQQYQQFDTVLTVHNMMMISYNLFVSFSHSLFWYCMYDVFFLIATGSFSNLTFFSKLLVSKNFSDNNGKSLIDVFYFCIHSFIHSLLVLHMLHEYY